MIVRSFLAALLLLSVLPSPAQASGAESEISHQHWHFSGPFGTFDRGALQRGYKIYREVCASCHSMNRVAFRNLEDLGYDENQIKAIAAEYTFTDGPNDEGDMFDRAGRPSDYFKPPFANDKAAQYANGGALPPDLSLIAKARHGGADYIYSILTGYEEPPAGTTLASTQHWNKAMPGHVIAMAPPLTADAIVYEDGTPQTVEQYSKDVAEFLTWAAEPHMETRKRTGLKVILFLAVFAGMMYAYKRKIWSAIH